MRFRVFFSLAILIFLFSCEMREQHIDTVVILDVEDISTDVEKTDNLPTDICPDKYLADNIFLFPSPKISFGTADKISFENFKISVSRNERLKDFFEEFSKFYNSNNNENTTEIQIISLNGIDKLFSKCNFSYAIKEGAYYLKIFKRENSVFVYIVADEVEGFYNAAKSISQMLYKRNLINSAIYDYPDVKYRGVAEAFYGKPWDEKDRIDVITYFAMLRFNLFLYSPKSDPYAWAMWRTPFDEKEEEKLREIAEHSKRLGIIPCYGVGPGYDIKFSNNKDYTTLLYKYKKLISFGFDTCLALAFDDTQKTLSEEDKNKFSDMAEAQTYLAKRLYDDLKKLKPDLMLAFVPNDYTTEWARADNYLSKISDGLRGLYQIAWTGEVVVSPTITEKDIDDIESIIKDTPILADNYPVCDLMFNGGAAFLGPITGRDSAIFKRITMYASNPMRYTISSIIPLGTIADMLWSPELYESEHSFLNSISFFARENRGSDIYEFATNLRSSLISEKESPELKIAIENFISDIDNCDSINYEILKTNFFDRFAMIDQILKDSADERFIDEMRPWINKLKDYGKTGNLALELMKKKCKNEAILENQINWLAGMIQVLKENKYRICAQIMDEFLNIIYERIKQQ